MKRKAGRPKAECGDSSRRLLSCGRSGRAPNEIIPTQTDRHISPGVVLKI